MVYVQYFQVGAMTGELIQACGDRGVVILDGRNSLSNQIQDAIKNNGHRRPNYEAFQICRGEAFTRSRPITGIINL